MINLLKVALLLLALFLIFFPMLPLRSKNKKFSTITGLKYDKPHFRMNAAFVIVAVVEIVLFAVLYHTIEGLGTMIAKIPVLGDFLSGIKNKLGADVTYMAFTVTLLIVNLLVIYLYVFLKSVVKKILDGQVYTDEEKQERKSKKKKKKNKKAEEEQEDFSDIVPDEQEEKKKSKYTDAENIPVLEHIRQKVKKKKHDARKKEGGDSKEVIKKNSRPSLLAIGFFEAPEYLYAKPWVRRMVSILQCFIYLAEAFYFLLFTLIFVSALFPVSRGIYDFLINFMRVQSWYVYPFLSLIVLQELCNTFKTDVRPLIKEEKEQKSEEEKAEENRIAIRSLASELKRYFDQDHKLRFYPGGEVKNDKFEYQFTNDIYRPALEYIKKKFADRTGNKGQSYLECMDAMFNEEHVYFCGSFYSEIGEYIIAYTYTRLLSGARMIFIVKDHNKRYALKKYILNRLVRMTGGSIDATWRVYTAEDRLDQADILVASPEDFKDNNIVENYPDFFEEVCNAVFIDADKVVSLESYLCPVLALRLLNATSDRIRFVFLSTDLIRGFAASSLPKLFCVDKVLSLSSAGDNERVEYTLWNKESLKNRIYYKHGQKLMSLEGIIAEKAYQYGIDGIRVITASPIDHGEREILTDHSVEINEFFKDVPNINYMIYSDERCNLAAAIYACTRFRGKCNSVTQIISKPYLLREYFMAKATKENFIKRSSFIQPRITEHAQKEKLSLLKIFCRASTKDGISIREFVSEMKDSISLSRIRGDVPLCQYCATSPKYADLNKTTPQDYAAYLIAALCDSPETEAKDSLAYKAKDYYLIVDHVNHDLYSLTKEKYISFRKVREVYEKVFACNERVTLRLNDTNIGQLDTFPSRVPLEYIVGQPLVYNNVEYEIEQISEDNKIIFLRRENVTYKNCFDIVFLRRYKIGSSEKIGQDGVLYNSESLLKEIRVSLQKVNLEGVTYGYYVLMSNNQSFNFVHGIEGNPHLEKEAVDKNRRNLQDGRMLRVTLTTGMECTDGMRLLCSAVFNEFIKTMFPLVYRCIAICPILEKPFDFSEEKEAETITEKIETFYPYLMAGNEDFKETDNHKMQFLFLNDCSEDVGVFDWFYDKLASNMQEFLINVYSYLYWLNSRPDLSHYIYFGLDKLPECFDLQGACKLFADYNIIISDSGEKNYETAADYEDEEKRRCSFCHRYMESGRYSFFDEERTMFICADCMDTVGTEERLQELHNEVLKYLENTYPIEVFGHADVVFTAENEPMKNLNEWYFRIDPDKRLIVVGFDLPERNTRTAILLGKILFWQHDNDLVTEYSKAHLSYEQIKYLQGLGDSDIADWIRNESDAVRQSNISEIEERIQSHTTEDGVQEEGYTSFSVMRELGEELRDLEEDVDYEDIEGEDYFDGLYDPQKVPRFWKRYFKHNLVDETGDEADDDGGNADDDPVGPDDHDELDDLDDSDGLDDLDDSDLEDEEDGTESDTEINCMIPVFLPNCPPPTGDEGADEPTDDPKEMNDDLNDSDEKDKAVDLEKVGADSHEEGESEPQEEGESEPQEEGETEPQEEGETEPQEEGETEPQEEGETEPQEEGETEPQEEGESEPQEEGETEPQEEGESESQEEGESEPQEEGETKSQEEGESEPQEEGESESQEEGESEPQEEGESEPQEEGESEPQEEGESEPQEEGESEPQEEGESEPQEEGESEPQEEGESEPQEEGETEPQEEGETEPQEEGKTEPQEEGETEPQEEGETEPQEEGETELQEEGESEPQEEELDLSDEDLDDEDLGLDDEDLDFDDEDLDLDDIGLEDEDGIKGKGDKKQKKEKEKRQKKEPRKLRIRKGEMGLRVAPYETEEDTNPALRVYNEIVRHAYNFDEGDFSRDGVDDSTLNQIFQCVKGDYPELFWVNSFLRSTQTIRLDYRCRKPSGELDIKQITAKLQEIKKGAKYFTHGITKKDDPYKALLTIYKRLILTLDYDGKGLEAGIDADMSKDDKLRSLHSALVRHKTVCAGYAVAMQYLLQLIGIPCAYVVSEIKGNSGHAFNIVKIGKYCYYLDATWGDLSNTKSGDKYRDVVEFDYCCVPYSEFIKASPNTVYNHIPNHENYPWFKKELKANRHEYYRYRNSYVSRYNEDKIVRIFAYCAEHYDKKEDGRFIVSFRCSGMELAHDLREKVRNSSNFKRIVGKAKLLLSKNKRATKLLDKEVEAFSVDNAPVVKIFFKSDTKE